MPSTPFRSLAYKVTLAGLQAADSTRSDQIAPQMLLVDLQELIIAAATADPWALDRKYFDHLIGCSERLAADQAL